MTGDRDVYVPLTTDEFIVGDQIGAGSFSHVYKALRKIDDTTIAVKAYKSRKGTQDLGRAANEMAFVKILKHPNIIGFIGCEIKKAYMYLAMEYAPYGTLLTVLKRRDLITELMIQTIMRHLMSALHFLEHKSILHGDVKPENILITNLQPELFIKLADFGVAQIVLRGPLKGSHMGSFAYMAPEMLLGFPYDTTADLFSAGVVMYELIYGHRPLVRRSKEEYLNCLRKRTTFQFSAPDNSKLSVHALDLVKSLLNYNPVARPRGLALTNHPFLQLGYPSYTPFNHYVACCHSLVKSVELANKDSFGQAYVAVTEAVLHLKIYSNSIQENDGMLEYTSANLGNYQRYLEQVERKITTPCVDDPIKMPVTMEALRCELESTPQFRAAVDMCLVGEMYIKQNNVDAGYPCLSRGIQEVLDHLTREPPGSRRKTVLGLTNKWISLLESVKADQLPRK